MTRRQHFSWSIPIRALAFLAAVVFIPITRAHAQNTADSTAVLQEVLRDYEKAFSASLAREGSPAARVGLVAQSFALRTIPATSRAGGPQRSIVEWETERPSHIQTATISGTTVRTADPVERQPRKCEQKTRFGVSAQVCGLLRDYDVIVALSRPIFSGTKATVRLIRRDNTADPARPVSEAILEYTLERAGGKWSVTSRTLIEAS